MRSLTSQPHPRLARRSNGVWQWVLLVPLVAPLVLGGNVVRAQAVDEARSDVDADATGEDPAGDVVPGLTVGRGSAADSAAEGDAAEGDAARATEGDATETDAAEGDATDAGRDLPADGALPNSSTEDAVDSANADADDAGKVGIDASLPALLDVTEADLVWVVPAAGAVVAVAAAAISLTIGTTTFLRYDGSRRELLRLDRNYTGLPDEDVEISRTRKEYEDRRRAYDDVGRGLLGAGALKLAAGLALAGLAGAAYYWQSLPADDGFDRASPPNDVVPNTSRDVPTETALSNAAPSDVAPSDAAPSDVAPSDVAPSDVAPTDNAAPTDAPSDVAPSDVTPSDTASNEAASSDVVLVGEGGSR